ncbi:hypothetical protein NM688_g6008 [Phlebia brevispora]|uniref:Uncharacterized protein n=1 Tax=Phlebia brevispora TaxID=194682 RepID=A0ACC1SL55_9APHY|nr:hypothetical protein NM688_g6008 [Phlebia brevispora]
MAGPPQPIHDFFGTNYMDEELGLQTHGDQDEEADISMQDIDEELQSEASVPSDQDDSDEEGEFSPDEMEEASWEPLVS